MIDTLKYTWNPVYAGFFTSGKPGNTRGWVIKLSNIHGKQHCCNSNRTNLCVPLCTSTVLAIGKRCPPPHDTHFSRSKTLHNQESRQLWFEMKKMEISYVVCLQQMENFNWKL